MHNVGNKDINEECSELLKPTKLSSRR